MSQNHDEELIAVANLTDEKQTGERDQIVRQSEDVKVG